MAAYVLVEVKVNDPVGYEDYKKLTAGTLTAYQGKFIVRGGKTETIEGNWSPERLVILEFPNTDLAKAWWASPEYTVAKQIRYKYATSRMLVAEGI
jgi:uncharacterized protein (DUF1330 family)